MSKYRLVVLLIGVVVSLGLIAGVLCACKTAEPIVIYLGSDTAYRGAVIPLSATLTGETQADFAVIEGQEYAYISDGALHIRDVAPYLATVTVRVRAGEHTKDASLTVGHTPVEKVEVVAVPPQKAGDSVTLHAKLTPSYADDNPISWSLSEGEEVASIEGNVLTLSSRADHNDLVGVIASAGGVLSSPKRVDISTVQPQSFEMSADALTLKREESAHLSAVVSPLGCEDRPVYQLVPSDYVARYVVLAGEVVTVSADAPEGSFAVEGVLGELRRSLTFTVAKTPVERVVLTKLGEDNVVHYGETISLYTHVYPLIATYPEVTMTVTPQDSVEWVEGGCRIATKEVGVPIVITATADGVSDSVMLTTAEIPVEKIEVSVSDSLSVKVGDSRTITATAFPADATYSEVTLRLTQGGEFARLDGDVIYFDSIGVGNDEVVVTATSGGVVVPVTFHIVPIPVKRIDLTTSDPVSELKAGDTVTFAAAVSPADASFPQVTYRLIEGGELGRMVGNVFEVWETAGRGVAKVVAETQDGVVSNVIELSVVGTMETLVVSSWSEIDNDPAYLDGHPYVGLDMRSLPKEAGETLLIVSDDVEYLLIVGAYEGTRSTCWHNFYLYFLTSDEIEVCFVDVGLDVTTGYTDAVVDFGSQAKVLLTTVGDCFVAGGNAYAPYSGALTVDGSWSDTAHPYGMNGVNGIDGGIALSAYDLTLSGEGNLTLMGGNGSSGTDGKRGADAGEDGIAGFGGQGGLGGDGGRAILSYRLTYDFAGTLTLFGGQAATGGMGGQGGIGSGLGLTAAELSGKHGLDGVAPDPVKTVESVRCVAGSPVINMGGLAARREVRPVSSVDGYAKALAAHYKVNVRYGTATTALGGYTITKQTDGAEQLLMLRGLDYALAIFGRNMFVELKANHANNTTVSFNLCDTIKRVLSSNTVYGVTSTGNSVWFATFAPRKRDYMWSNYYNIMVHEMLHLLTFGMGSTSSNPMRTGLPTYNQGYGYTTTAAGVYDPATGQDAQNSPFLTKYSKSDFNEDISDNLSLLCMLVAPCDLTEASAPLTQKAIYITKTYQDYFRNVRLWRGVKWLRFAETI